ncbi:DUF5067 domain-containing protein [Cellulomonas composti]|uniref:DUF5067 domain-containing protein n=1 Tax=Cellulomonas composti TaxID=266130 RepID=A0A511J939_9CELL|nr:DUF5067 domain-containing protein [Cellulomonas composti]GEL94498.1 hypothetical protein CCO02nite_11560 [Cellulomonas composti]
MTTRTTVSIALVALLGLAGLAGCSDSGSGGGGDGSSSAENSESAAPAAPVDLTGEWEQSNDAGDGSAHAATIVSDTITIYWVSDDDSKSLYWAGTVDVPQDAGDSFTWDSVNDKSKTDSALLASGDDTKTFAYEDGIISYETSALGQTWTVELKQTSTTPAAESEVPEESSDFDVTIEGATFSSDYEGKPVIVVSFAFTNNSDEAASFVFSVNAQAFQGGIELDDTVIGVDDIDKSIQMADIQPGVTATVQKPFLLRDDSTVSVEVRELFSLSDAVLASQEFSVSQ